MGRLEDEAAAVGEQHQIGPRDGVEVQAVSIQVARSLVDWSRTWSLMSVVSSLSCVETRRENLPIAGRLQVRSAKTKSRLCFGSGTSLST